MEVKPAYELEPRYNEYSVNVADRAERRPSNIEVVMTLQSREERSTEQGAGSKGSWNHSLQILPLEARAFKATYYIPIMRQLQR